MKFRSLLVFGTTLLVLSACSGEDGNNEEETDDNNNLSEETSETKETSNVTNGESVLNLNDSEAGWVNFNGEHAGSIDYRVSPKIEYDSSETYVLNIDAYISYFNDDEFIETKLTSKGPIESIDNADNIRVSYHKSFEERLTLTKE